MGTITRRIPLSAGAGLLALSSVLAGAPSASAVTTDGPDYEMPFPCRGTWTGSSRPSHSPSSRAIDWNRANDLGAAMVASAPGVVARVQDLGNRSYGRYIIVDHGGGRSSLYAHLLSLWTTTGQAVDQGTLLGRVGSTGGSTGPHLHFEERLNGTDQTAYFHRLSFRMGSTLSSRNCPDVPLVGDWDGNRTSNIGVMRRGAPCLFSLKRPGRAALALRFGRATDEAVSGDWDGNGVTDIGVRRPSWRGFLLRSASGATTRITLGRIRDVGVTGDWNGNGRTDVGVWNPGSRVWSLRLPSGAVRTVRLGALGDRPVTGDWNGDRTTDLGVFSRSTATFTLRSVARSGAVTVTRVRWGGASSLPVAGDWNADGIGDVGVWNPATATFSLRLTPRVAGRPPVTRAPVWGARRG